MQTNPENKADFESISHERYVDLVQLHHELGETELTYITSPRAFADFIFGSMILHFFCVNFIN